VKKELVLGPLEYCLVCMSPFDCVFFQRAGQRRCNDCHDCDERGKITDRRRPDCEFRFDLGRQIAFTTSMLQTTFQCAIEHAQTGNKKVRCHKQTEFGVAFGIYQDLFKLDGRMWADEIV